MSGANLSNAFFFNTEMRETNLIGANLNGAILSGADLTGANLHSATLIKSLLRRSSLIATDLSEADLSEANLKESGLQQAMLLETNFTGANLSNCHVYGISAWNVKLDNAVQTDLVVTDYDEPPITVDQLEVAQFVHLLLNNQKIRDVITTIGQRAVLILGRFTLPERKEILEVMRIELREKGFLPIVFDFEKSAERDFTETIQVLAGMCLFVIADITNPKSSPLELQATVPDYMIPFAPIIQAGESPFAMFVNLQKKYRWVLDVRTYNDEAHLLSNFESGIIKPALEKHNELIGMKNEALKIRSIDEI